MPSGFLTPQTTFSLNGVAYETLLGGAVDDPLIRLLARGAAGYRTAAKALQYALQQPRVSVSGAESSAGESHALNGTLSGRFRDTNEPCEIPFTVRLAMSPGQHGELRSADAQIEAVDLDRIAAARRSR